MTKDFTTQIFIFFDAVIDVHSQAAKHNRNQSVFKNSVEILEI